MQYRYQGYREMLDEVGISFNPDYFLQGERGRLNARVLAKKLLTLEEPPTAVFASSDTRAIGVLDAAHELNVKVPTELSVIGYDGIRDATYYNLTTIDQNLFDSGVKGANMLLDLLSNRIKPPYKQYVKLDLLARSTTAPLN
jgi:DNA-binding LacI/PurR family transcriptional regulator